MAGPTLRKELEAAQREAFEDKPTVDTWMWVTDVLGNTERDDFHYVNLVESVVSLFKDYPDIEMIQVELPGGTVATFKRRQHYVRWAEARVSIPFEAVEPSKWEHIDYLIEEEYRDRQRRRWLSEVW